VARGVLKQVGRTQKQDEIMVVDAGVKIGALHAAACVVGAQGTSLRFGLDVRVRFVKQGGYPLVAPDYLLTLLGETAATIVAQGVRFLFAGGQTKSTFCFKDRVGVAMLTPPAPSASHRARFSIRIGGIAPHRIEDVC
jgi:hypothetical protein